MRKVREQSELTKSLKTAVLRVDPSVSIPEFIYSIHTFNSREQAKKLLRKHLDQVGLVQCRF